MTAGRRAAALGGIAAAFAAQALLQVPLRRANEVRGARTLHAAPSSLAFRLASGGVRLAAADALWLSVLPRLGRSWAEPERKGAWIEAVTGTLVDANPRALNPPLYAAYFLERVDRRHPGIERVLVRAMEAEGRAPFRPPRKVNADSWELPEAMGMNLFLFGGEGERERAGAWLRRAAAKPLCPTIVIDFLGAVASKAGRPLEAWDLWLLRASDVADPGLRASLRAVAGSPASPAGEEPRPENPAWRDHYLAEADRERVAVLRRWAEAAEAGLGRFPGSPEEVLSGAPEAEREALAARPGRKAALLAGLVLRPRERDLEVPALTERLAAEQRARLELLARSHEAALGVPPRTFEEVRNASDRPLPPHPRHGVRWDWDPAGARFVEVPWPEDPRLRR